MLSQVLCFFKVFQLLRRRRSRCGFWNVVRYPHGMSYRDTITHKGNKKCLSVVLARLDTLANVSQLPLTKILGSTLGSTDTDMTSPVCSVNCCFVTPISTSQDMHVLSPEEVIIVSVTIHNEVIDHIARQ